MKNLENVQGDERDHMILSVGYGPTTAGSVPNRFGPINLEGGERRLNVAVTRARRSMTVVHSLSPEDIRSTAAGARHLRRYLEYVRNPDRAVAGEVTGTGEPESPFEEAVLDVLRRQGYGVDAQVGVSGYRIDLAIRSEGGDGYELGIECDGATYHSSPAARDRDWLRQQILEGLGWNIHRVWSTAWIRDPERELRAIEEALGQVRADWPGSGNTVRPDGTDAEREMGQGDGVPAATPDASPVLAPLSRGSGAQTYLFDEYRHFRTNTGGIVLAAAPRETADLVREVVAAEHPVHVETVMKRVRDSFWTTLTQRVREHIRHAIGLAVTEGSVRLGDRESAFLTLPGDRPVRPRRRAGRDFGHIADAELEQGLLLVARRTFGSSQADLVRETARQFQFRIGLPGPPTRSSSTLPCPDRLSPIANSESRVKLASA